MVASADANLQRFRLAAWCHGTIGTFLRRLILPQKDADVLLVLLLLEILEEGKNALVAARLRVWSSFARARAGSFSHGVSIEMPSRFANSASARRLLS